jgi:prepilin-type N-terminal cleavage/methylation domain-containing protein
MSLFFPFQIATMISKSVMLNANLCGGSTSGWTTRNGQSGGFTLIELIVVISLIGLMLFFSLPRLQNNPFLDDSKKSARWLIGKVQALKESAIRDQKQYSLHFDLDGGLIWETNESMSQEDYESAVLNSYALPDDVRILDIEYPAKEKIISGQTEITFYKAGYTDKAFIHLQDGETYLSFLIEPFLTNVQIIEKYVSFED